MKGITRGDLLESNAPSNTKCPTDGQTAGFQGSRLPGSPRAQRYSIGYSDKEDVEKHSPMILQSGFKPSPIMEYHNIVQYEW